MPIYWGSIAHLMKERTKTAVELELKNRQVSLLEAEVRAAQARLNLERLQVERDDARAGYERSIAQREVEQAERAEDRTWQRENIKADRELKLELAKLEGTVTIESAKLQAAATTARAQREDIEKTIGYVVELLKTAQVALKMPLKLELKEADR